MRNLFLALVLANGLMLAWQFWVDPAPSASVLAGTGDLVAFNSRSKPNTASPATSRKGATPAPPGTCLRLGPVPTVAAAQQVAEQLAARGIDAVPFARDSQVWLGHWVQIGGFVSVPAAETARQRLVAGGLPDAYLMQNGAQPMISLGVFRDLSGAERVAKAARSLGFEVSLRDRHRPAVEQWLLIRPRAGQNPGPADLSLAGDRIMRTERTDCEAVVGALLPAGQPAAAAGPVQPL